MKLYYTPGACSLSPHIALLEAGLPYDLVTRHTSSGSGHASYDARGVAGCPQQAGKPRGRER